MSGQNKKRPLIALSLGGGGAKTFAHLGILDALKDEGIKTENINDDEVKVVEGLIEGEEIVIKGSYELKEGDEVNPIRYDELSNGSTAFF
ncbi:MAG: hypothetical protein U9R14_00845 [Patescibacteria group bacterium]|nr:hypothetical protein [Patescibacteria group bacterium]